MPPSPTPLVAPKVLIADDSPVARLAVGRKLAVKGVDVIEQASATERWGAAGLACALLDLDLGDGDGTDVAAALRAERPDLPVAFFSSLGASENLERAKSMGPVFAKPGDLDAAIAWVVAQAKRV
jgi:two-component system response regulator RegA